MSTSCMTIVRQRTFENETDYKTENLFRFYRHWDGYPEGHGKDIAEAVLAAEERYMPKPDSYSYYDCLTNRNWCQRLMRFLFENETDMEVMPVDGESFCVSYVYIIEGDYADYGGKHSVENLPVTIAVYEAWRTGNYEATGKSLFKGTAVEYMRWLEEQED